MCCDVFQIVGFLTSQQHWILKLHGVAVVSATSRPCAAISEADDSRGIAPRRVPPSSVAAISEVDDSRGIGPRRSSPSSVSACYVRACVCV